MRGSVSMKHSTGIPGMSFSPRSLAISPSSMATRTTKYFVLVFVVLDRVGTDDSDRAFELGGRLLVEGREAQMSGLAQMHLIDVGRGDLDLDPQRIVVRHDQHHRLTLRDNTAHRMDVELMHGSALRRAEIDTPQLVLGRDPSLQELGQFSAISASSLPTSLRMS